MHADDARRVLWLRSLETSSPSPFWTDADRDAVGAQALRRLGEAADRQAWVIERARLASEWLAQRPAARSVACPAAPSTLVGWWGVGLLAVALLAGLFTDQMGNTQRFNLLAPPMAALVVWNLAVYVALGARALVGARRRMPARPQAPAPTAPDGAAAASAPAWTDLMAPVRLQRAAAGLHLAALAVALGAVASMYLRGLSVAYAAGWDSTFLDAAQVHAVIHAWLGPAAALLGLSLPDVAGMAALRFSAGPGASAAPWIHLHAATVLALIVLPRAALAAVAARRTQRLLAQVPVPLDDAYGRALAQEFARRRGRPATRALVLPYNLHLDTPRRTTARAALQTALQQHLEQDVEVMMAAGLALGAEDDLPAALDTAVSGLAPEPSDSAHQVVALFAMTATPEPAVHGRFIAALQARQRRAADHRGGRATVTAVLDASAFRARLAAVDRAPREAQRTQAWRALLGAAGVDTLVVDLGNPSQVP